MASFETGFPAPRYAEVSELYGLRTKKNVLDPDAPLHLDTVGPSSASSQPVMNEELVSAAWNGRTADVARLLTDGADANERRATAGTSRRR